MKNFLMGFLVALSLLLMAAKYQEERRTVTVAAWGTDLSREMYVIANDGTIWWKFKCGNGLVKTDLCWKQLPSLPQPGEAK